MFTKVNLTFIDFSKFEFILRTDQSAPHPPQSTNFHYKETSFKELRYQFHFIDPELHPTQSMRIKGKHPLHDRPLSASLHTSIQMRSLNW